MTYLLTAIARKNPGLKRKKRPLSPNELPLIFSKLPPTSIDTIITRALMAFAIGGALRSSEYTSPCKYPNPAQQIRLVRKDRIIRFKDKNNRDSMVFFFFQSKKNHEWRREFAVMPCVCDSDLPCAFHETLRLENIISNIKPSTLLFVWKNGSLVTYADTLRCFKNAAALIGIDSTSIGTHSARKTRITIGIAQGLPDSILLQLGRWKALDSIKPYIALRPMDLNNVLTKH